MDSIQMMAKVKSIAELTRFSHAIMLAFAVLLGEAVALGKVPGIDALILLSLLVPILSEMGAFALNDYMDIETDRRNRKTDRPLVNGSLSPRFALWFSIACLAGSSVAAFFINMPAFAIAISFNILSAAYNWRLKDLPLIGNMYIGTTMAIPFLFGSLVVSDSIPPFSLALAGLAFMAGLAREIIKSAQDMEGDREARGSRTLPLVIGERPAVLLAVFIYLCFIALCAYLFSSGLADGWIPLGMVCGADLMIGHICLRLISSGRDAYRYARNASLIAFMAGMIGLLISALA